LIMLNNVIKTAKERKNMIQPSLRSGMRFSNSQNPWVADRTNIIIRLVRMAVNILPIVPKTMRRLEKKSCCFIVIAYPYLNVA